MSTHPALAVVSHDAGGAEILSSYLRREGLPALLAVEGPAVRVFKRKLPDMIPIPLEDAVRKARGVLCGTGWQSDFEWRAIGLARELGRRSTAFLDHWMHYCQRFERKGVQHLPDELWVGDTYADRIARAVFKSVPVRLVSNPYFEDIRSELAELQPAARSHSTGSHLLYLCEPMREIGLLQHGDERHFGYVEEEALTYFLENVRVISRRPTRVVIRTHPAERQDKYDWAAKREDLRVEFSSGTSLVEDIAAADIVVGLESMAMVIALMAKKRVVSAIPPGGRPCQLPHEGIESLSRLTEMHAGQ